MKSQDPIRSGMRMVMGFFCLIAWITLFGVGLFVSSKPYLDALKDPLPGATGSELTAVYTGNLVRAILTYTVTNVAILACLSGLLGGLASHMIYETLQRQNTGARKPDPAKDSNEPENGDMASFEAGFLCENPVASMLRSFCVFLAFIAGTYIFADKPFDSPTSEQFARVAGSVSLIAYVVGYDPTIFSNMIKRFVSVK